MNRNDLVAFIRHRGLAGVATSGPEGTQHGVAAPLGVHTDTHTGSVC